MAEYRLTDRDVIERAADGAQIPTDEGNADYRDYLAWVAAGNTPDPAPLPLPTAAIEESSRALASVRAKRLAAEGRTAEALALALKLIEGV